MEFREYYKILRSNPSIVIYTIVIFVVTAYIWSNRQGEFYSASLNLNISRVETQNSADYRYDQFYRLQADEKIADAVEQWLKSPGTVSEILNKAGINVSSKSIRDLSKNFRAEKISSVTVNVRYLSSSEEEAKKISSAVSAIIDERIKSLNSEARDPFWFKVLPADFIILRNVQDLRINLSAAFILGLFFGTLLAFGKHYISE